MLGTIFTILGSLGLFLFGMKVMSEALQKLSGEKLRGMMRSMTSNRFLGLGTGLGITCLVQSSSATLGITITLASQGVIGFETAAALVLGENIGTTITAYLASIGATTNAKRAAYFHMVFNVLGVVWITSIFRAYLPFIEWVNEFFFGVTNITEMKLVDGAETFPHISFAIAFCQKSVPVSLSISNARLIL